MERANVNSQQRKAFINDLQTLASEVLKLKTEHRQKRPIVIEFSGSPKSGKTSCINSLELFLKRNGFKVEIIQERASVCPVSDKQSPMFNIWTACTSLSGMLGVLERKEPNCDVLILDRGLFDSMCWFDWLYKKSTMESNHKKVVEEFFLMDALVRRIDIVFAFSVEPSISIEREYANLLTDKLGSIMNENVLSEYLLSVRSTIKNKQCHFHKIFEIDTSTRNQDDVGKEVTEKTLNTLKDLLIEKVGYFSREEKVIDKFKENPVVNYQDIKSVLPPLKFGMRNEVEENNELLQPLPIAVITNKERTKVLVIKKSPKAVSDSSLEKDKLLAYVGGHSRYEDFTEVSGNDFLSVCKYTLQREVKEEIGISVAFDNVIPLAIYTGSNHIAFCFVIELDLDNIKLRLDPHELILNKGKSKSGSFIEVNEFFYQKGSFELWTINIMKSIFNITPDEQMTLFSDGSEGMEI